jgi:hypothetical protein
VRLDARNTAKERETGGGSQSHASLTPETAPRPALRVVVDAIEPRPGPIRVAPWLTILDPERSIRANLANLERVVAGLTDARRVGDRLGIERFEDELEDLLERLEACGCKVRVEGLP